MKMDKVALDIRPFTRLIWRSKEAKVEWEPKLREASKVYHIAEWKMVSEGQRRCATVHINRQNYEAMLSKLVEDGLHFKPIARTAKYQGFSHKHIIPQGTEDYDVYGVLAVNRKDALRFAELSKSRANDMHMKIGDLLGYPRCCSEAFTKRWSQGIIDPVFQAALKDYPTKIDTRSTEEVIKAPECSVETNQMLRYFGLRMTSHLPCSFNCKNTIDTAKKWKETMKKIDSKACGWLEELLKMPIRWDAYRGILIVTTPHFRGITTTGFTENKRVIRVGELDW